MKLTPQGSVSSATLDKLVAQEFDLQKQTYFSKRPVYISTHPTDPVYIYHDPDLVKWTMRPVNVHYGTLYAWADDQSMSPQNISSQWMLDDNQMVDIQITCAGKIYINFGTSNDLIYLSACSKLIKIFFLMPSDTFCLQVNSDLIEILIETLIFVHVCYND